MYTKEKCVKIVQNTETASRKKNKVLSFMEHTINVILHWKYLLDLFLKYNLLLQYIYQKF